MIPSYYQFVPCDTWVTIYLEFYNPGHSGKHSQINTWYQVGITGAPLTLHHDIHFPGKTDCLLHQNIKVTIKAVKNCPREWVHKREAAKPTLRVHQRHYNYRVWVCPWRKVPRTGSLFLCYNTNYRTPTPWTAAPVGVLFHLNFIIFISLLLPFYFIISLLSSTRSLLPFTVVHHGLIY